MEAPPPSFRTMLRSVRNPLWSTAALVIVVYGLREAKEILVPITVAVMLAIICAPAVRWLKARRVPNVVAVLMAVGAIVVILGALGALVGVSISGFQDNIPAYRDRLTTTIDHATVWLSHHGIKITRSQLLQSGDVGHATEKAANFMVAAVVGFGAAISNLFIVVLTLVLLLLEGWTIPRKLRALSGDPEADISHYERIAHEVQSYLAIKTLVSVFVGLAVGIWCALLDVDFAVLWGLLAFLLNYIPNIGGVLAAIPCMLLALIQHGLPTALALGSGHFVIHMVLGNVVEPMWMGRKLGLSTTVVVVSLIAWNWVWGPVGMLLSVPLTMVIKIMLEHSREWSVVAVLLDSGQEAKLRDEAASRAPPPPDRLASTMRPPRRSDVGDEDAAPTLDTPPHIPSSIPPPSHSSSSLAEMRRRDSSRPPSTMPPAGREPSSPPSARPTEPSARDTLPGSLGEAGSGE
jgi:predicted PurR-regulated permease PerM